MPHKSYSNNLTVFLASFSPQLVVRKSTQTWKNCEIYNKYEKSFTIVVYNRKKTSKNRYFLGYTLIASKYIEA